MKIQKYFFILCIHFLTSIIFLNAQEKFLEEAKNLFEEGKFIESLNIFERIENFPDLEDDKALYYLGRIYSEGLGGISIQRKKGYKFYQKSAKKDYTPSKTKLALYFLAGDVVTQNFKKSVRLLKEAKMKKDKEAELILNSLYFGGYLKNKDLAKIYAKDNWEKRRKEQNQKNKNCFQIFSIELIGNNQIDTKKFKNIIFNYLFRCLYKKDVVELLKAIIVVYDNKGYLVSPLRKIDQEIGEVIIEIKENQIIYDSKNFRVINKLPNGFKSIKDCETEEDRTWLKNAFPDYKKDKKIPLNFNSLGQGLKQIKRLQTSRSASMKIGSLNKEVREICIILNLKKRVFLDWTFTPLDEDSPYGDLEHKTSFTMENILSLNESIGVSYGEAYENTSDLYNNSSSFNFSIPLGYWTHSFDYLMSGYSLTQQTGNREFISKGDSMSRTFNTQREFGKRKNNRYATKLSISTNENRVFINNTLVDVSSRNSATARLSLVGTFVVGRGSLQSTLSYAEGLALFGADEDAPDIRDDEFHNQYSLWSSNTSYSINFLKNFPISYNTRFFAQATDRESVSLTIGGSGSVRGYSSNSYSDDIGGYFKNTFSSYLFQKLSFLGSFANAFNFSLFYDYGCVESIFGAKNHRCLSGGGASLNFSWKAFSVFYSYEVPISSSKPFTTEESIVRRMSASLGFAF